MANAKAKDADKGSENQTAQTGTDQLNGPAQQALTAGTAERIITVGALAKDDGVRTADGAHPMDPMYLGTKIAETEGVKHAEEFRADRAKKLEAAEAPMRGDQPSAEAEAGEKASAA